MGWQDITLGPGTTARSLIQYRITNPIDGSAPSAAHPGGMAEELPVRRVEVGFVGAPPVQRIGRASGVSEVEVDGRVVRCLVCGSFQPFLEAVRGHEVISLESTRTTVKEVDDGAD
jgi:hypothetical protein